jgi:L-amino acid N-acyltransferase YncA
MEKKERLKDGTHVLIRHMRDDDVEGSLKFFQDLPEEDRRYLRSDVTNRAVVEQRVRDISSGRVERLVAVVGDEIVGDGALELTGPGWTEHVGELRLIIAHPYQRMGLGMLMARELYYLVLERKLEKVVVRMLRPQARARKIFKKLGFREERLWPEFAKDMKGEKQDMIMMSCNIEEMFEELEQFFTMSDWQRNR